MTHLRSDDAYAPASQGLGLAEATRVVLLNKALIASVTVAGAIISVILAFLIKPVYTGKASFLPPHSTSSGASAFGGQLGALESLGGIKDPSMIYVGILESRTVADELIQRFNLNQVYGTKKLSATEASLASHTKFMPGKDSLVAINVVDTNAQRAADIANAYLSALAKQNDRLAITEAAQRRLFYEKQLVNEKNLLADAEVALSQTEEKTGIIQPGAQVQLQLSAIAQTQAAISSRETELAALSRTETGENPMVIGLRSQITALRSQLTALEASKNNSSPGNVEIPTGRIPELTEEYVRRERDVKYHEALYELLLKQYESAKLDEADSAPMMEVVDYAVVPDTKSGPHRLVLTIVGTVVSALLGIAWVLIPAVWRIRMEEPGNAATWQALREAARFRS